MQIGDEALYEYDFGDGWRHCMLLEGKSLSQDGVSCPRCTVGERACPAEDCGGFCGYDNVVEILKGKKNAEYREMVAWLKSHAKYHHPYDSEHFRIDRGFGIYRTPWNRVIDAVPVGLQSVLDNNRMSGNKA